MSSKSVAWVTAPHWELQRDPGDSRPIAFVASAQARRLMQNPVFRGRRRRSAA
jgi:hypothetical protein